MGNKLRIALALVVLIVADRGQAILPRRLLDFDVKHAATAAFAESFPSSAGPTLLLTSFYPFGSDSVYAVVNISQVIHGHLKATLTVLDSDASWPNQATSVPSSTIAASPDAFLLTACGFFVSKSKSTGAVSLLDVSPVGEGGTAVKQKISTDADGYFYHQAQWLDVNGDGRMDVMAARARKPSEGNATGELVWLEQPATSGAGASWTTHIITDASGPDNAFSIVDLDNDGIVEVVAAQFFDSQRLSIWWCGAPSKKWSDCEMGKDVTSTSIDERVAGVPFFNVEWVDLNGDGRRDVLATTNLKDGKGGVYAYEQPADPRQPNWPRHTLASGYSVTKSYLPGRGAPGTARAFIIDAHAGHVKPAVLVSADDGGFVDLLVAHHDANVTDWSYERTRVVNSTGTIGNLAIGDVDHDGLAEFAVPLYAESKVAIYTFNEL